MPIPFRKQDKQAAFVINETMRKVLSGTGIDQSDFLKMNPMQLAKEWDENAAVLYIRQVLTRLEEIKDSIPDEVKTVISNALREIADIFLNVENLIKLSHIPDATRRQKEKVARILFDSLAKDMNNLGNVFTVLTAAGVVIPGAAGAILTPAGGAAVTLIAGGAATYSSYRLLRTTAYYYSPSLQFRDNLIRYKNTNKKIDKLHMKIDRLRQKQEQVVHAHKEKKQAIMQDVDSKIALINTIKKREGHPQGKQVHELTSIPLLEKQIEDNVKELNKAEESFYKKTGKMQAVIQARESKVRSWVDRQEIFKHQAAALVQVDNKQATLPGKKQRIADSLKDKFVEEVAKESVSREDVYKYRTMTGKLSERAFYHSLQQTATPETERLVIELKKNIRDDVIAKTVDTIAYSLMATGGIVASFAPAGAQGAPAILAVGTLLIASGFLLKFGKEAAVRLTNMVATKYNSKQERQSLLQEYIKPEEGLSRLDHPALKDLTLNEKLKYRLSYEQQGHVKVKSETEWYTYLNELNKKERNTLLNVAEKKVIDARILSEVLTGSPHNTNSDIMQQLSDKTKQQIIKRASRHSLRVSITSSLKSGMKSAYQTVRGFFNGDKDAQAAKNEPNKKQDNNETEGAGERRPKM